MRTAVRLQGSRLGRLGGAWPRLRLVAGLVLLAALTTAQQPVTLPLDDNGRPILPPGAYAATAYTIDTFAGTGERGFAGDGGPAASAQLDTPGAVAVDREGRLLVVDTHSHRLRRIDSDGTISTLAGTGTVESTGDGGPAAEAGLNGPTGVAVDAEGSVYVCEALGHRIRKIDPAGLISTVAGTGDAGSAGDGGAATLAQLNRPMAVATGPDGSLFVAEYQGKRLRKIDQSGTISTIAGDGTSGGGGDGGPAIRARLNFPSGIAVDEHGNVFVSDVNEARIRKISYRGIITTVVGTGVPGHAGDNGPAVQADIMTPSGVALDGEGNLFLTEFWTSQVRKVDSSGIITTIAGIGEQVSSGDMGPAAAAGLDRPRGIAVDTAGNIYVAEATSHRVRVLRPDLRRHRFPVALGRSGETVVLTVADGGELQLGGKPLLDGTAVTASNGNAYAIGQAANGEIVASYVPEEQSVTLAEGKSVTVKTAEDGGWRIGDQVAVNGYRHADGGREYFLEWTGARWRLAQYTIRTVAGAVDVPDGVPATETTLYDPYFVAVDSVGSTYVTAHSEHRVRKIDRSGIVTTLAGTGERGFAGDGGPAVLAELDNPKGVAVGPAGDVYVADSGNARIRRIDAAGTITTVADLTFRMRPHGLAADAVGNIYFTVDSFTNHLVRRIDAAGQVSTVAGTPGERGGYSGGGQATAARLYEPRGIAVDSAGSIFVADARNHRVRKIDPSGAIITIAGSGERGRDREGGLAIAFDLSYPGGVAVDAAGNVFVSEMYNSRIVRIDGGGRISAVAADWPHTGRPAVDRRLAIPRGLAVTASGDLVVAASGSDLVLRVPIFGPITALAGNGEPFDRRDGGPAGRAQFGYPGDVVADAGGNAYVADFNQVRRIDAAGNIQAIAGTEDFGFSGDGGPASAASLEGPRVLALDSAGNLYVTSPATPRVRKIDASGIISTVAGSIRRGFAGDGGPATQALFRSPNDMAIDSLGNLYVADRFDHRVRRIDGSGTVSTLAGTGVRDTSFEFGYVTSTGDGAEDITAEPEGIAPAAQARLNYPYGLGLDGDDNLYVADWGNRHDPRFGRVGKIDTTDPNPRIEPVTLAEMPRIASDFAVDPAGNLYVAYRGRVIKFGSDGRGSTIAGGGIERFSGTGEPAAGVTLGLFMRISVGPDGEIWISDRSSRRIHVLEPVP